MKIYTIHVSFFFIIGLFTNFSIAQNFPKWFDPESILSTILLEKQVNDTFVPHGTGFLILPYESKSSVIITCEHVLRNPTIFLTIEIEKKYRDAVRKLSKDEQREIVEQLKKDNVIWNISEDFFRIKVNLKKDSSFFIHPDNLDIAAFKTTIWGTMPINNIGYKFCNLKQIGVSRIQEREKIAVGDDIYFIGFPLGIGTPDSIPTKRYFTTKAPKHALRKGIISWVSEDYDEFLLDAISLNGNSGSPVFKVNYIPGEPPYFLIGIIFGHLENDKSNIGLAQCLSIDEIKKVIKLVDK